MNGKKKFLLIDLENFVIHVEGEPFKEKLRLKFDSLSRKFYLAVIALVVNEMKKAGQVTSIKMENHYNTLVFLNEKMGRKLGSSKKKDLLGRIYRTWKVLGDLEKAEHFEIMDREKIYFKQTREKRYECEDEEHDSWANLFGLMGSETQIRLRLSIDKLSLTLEDVQIKYRGSDRPWEDFLNDIESHAEPGDELQNDSEYRGEQGSLDIIEKYLNTIRIDPRITTLPLLGLRKDMRDSGVFIKRTLSLLEDESFAFGLDPLVQLKDMERGILIESDPCSGKTALSKFMMTQLADDYVNNNIIPIWVRLHEYSNDIKESLYICALNIATRYANFIEDEKAAFLKMINKYRHRILLFLDGFDEILRNRRKVIEEIAALPEGVRFVVTSRKTDHNKDLRVERRYSLDLLDRKVAEAYANHMFESHNVPQNIRNAFMNRLHNKTVISQLASLPFFLIGMCLQVIKENEVPSTKARLYGLIVKWIVDHFLDKEVNDPTLVEYFTAKRIGNLSVHESIYSELALGCLEKGEIVFAKSDIIQVIDNVSQDTGLTNPNPVLLQVIMDSGILEPFDTDPVKYAFVHLSIMEYFGAVHIINAQKWRQVINENVGKESWRDVLLIMIGLLGKEHFEEIFKMLTKEQDFFLQRLLLAVEGTNELESLPIDKNDLINNVCDGLRKHPAREGLLISFLNKGGQFVGDIILKLLEGHGIKRKLQVIGMASYLRDDRIIRELLHILKTSKDNEILREAISQIGECGYEEAVEILIGFVRNKKRDIFIRIKALDSLWKIGNEESINELLRISKTRTEDTFLRMRAVSCLDPTRSEKELVAVLESLDSKEDKAVRWLAIYTLRKCKSDGTIVSLLKNIVESQKEETEIRMRAAYALEEIGSESAKRILLNILKKEEDIEVRCQCLRAFSYKVSTKVEAALRNILNSTNEPVKVRIEAAEVLYSRTSIETRKTLHRILSSGEEDIELRRTCLKAIGNRGTREVIEKCITILRSKEDVRLRETSVEMLGYIGTEKEVKPIVEILISRDEDTGLRIACAKALGKISSEKAMDTLMDRAKDIHDDRGLRLTSLIAMREIGGEGGEYAVSEALNESNEWTIPEREEILRHTDRSTEKSLDMMIEGYKKLVKENSMENNEMAKRLLEMIWYYSGKHGRVITPAELSRN